MIHYSWGFLCFLRGLIKGEKDFCGHNVHLMSDIDHDSFTGECNCIVKINGVFHEVTIKPIFAKTTDDSMLTKYAEIIANIKGGDNV